MLGTFFMKKTIYIYRYNIVLSFLIVILLTVSGCGVRPHAILPRIPDQPVVRKFEKPKKEQVDSLMEIYGNHKIFVDDFLEPALIALSYYPELKNVKIKFKYSREVTTLAARPHPFYLLSERKYLVLINNKKNFQGIRLEEAPFNAQIGVIGHELAHIVDYDNYNFWGILGIYFRFSDTKRKPLFEKEIDKATIERGLGWQLYDWAAFSMYEENSASKNYVKFKRNNYMQPDEIKQLISSFLKYGSVE